jgi:transcriptional regulator with XRE-family HTH domain
MQPTEQPATVSIAAATETESFGSLLYRHRLAARMTQADVSAAASVSTSYYSALENGKRLPPPRRTAQRLVRALGVAAGAAADDVLAAAAYERGTERADSDLPPEVRLLITDLRIHAFALPRRFVIGLRAKVREVVM